MDTEDLEITVQDLEWMRFQQELSAKLCTIFDIPYQTLGLNDGQIVDGTIQPVPLALPPVTKTT